MSGVQDKKDALATLVEIEQQNLHESIAALRSTAHREVDVLRERLDTVKERLNITNTIVEHRYKLLFGALAIGVVVGLRRATHD